ncbi:hypothetical protein SDC9_119984 [bioreactor metagenome]|uniref:Uncharacterized protein n=1 Tax=bioreactor metagenome TaxID=1076179 RepID=A0A645C6L0_9ZZZZ
MTKQEERLLGEIGEDDIGQLIGIIDHSLPALTLGKPSQGLRTANRGLSMPPMVGCIDGDSLCVEICCKTLIAKTMLSHTMQDEKHCLHLGVRRNPDAIPHRFPIAAAELPDG